MRNIEREVEKALERIESTDTSELNRLKELAYLIKGVRPVTTTLEEYKSWWAEFERLRKAVTNE